MPLIPAKCTACGGVLSTDDTKDAAICPYCGNAYIVEQAIQNFSTTYVVNNNIQADTVIMGGVEKEFDISAGTLKKYIGEAVDVIIPDNVLRIGNGAFQGLTIRSVTIPSSVEIIGKRAFYGCRELREVNLSSGLKGIEPEAFAYCTRLKALYIPDGVVMASGCVEGINGLYLSLSSSTVELSKQYGSIFGTDVNSYKEIEAYVYIDDKRAFADSELFDFLRGCKLPHRKRRFEDKSMELVCDAARKYWNCDDQHIEYSIIQEPKSSMLFEKHAIIEATYKD